MAEKDTLAELEELTERGRRLLERVDLSERPRALEYLQQGLNYLQAAFEAMATPEGVMEAWFAHFEGELSDPEGWDEADHAPALVALSSEASRQVLTPKRLELLSLLAEDESESVTALAERARRPIESVSRDLQVLANFGFIAFERDGKWKKPVLLRDHVLIQLRDVT